MKTITLILIIFFSAFAFDAQAELKMPAIFSDHMVLERNGSVPVWGWAAPGESVTVSLGSIKANTTADNDGKWMVYFKNLDVSEKPLEINIIGQSNQITIHDVLVGDVWICAGEANMAFPLDQASTAKQEVAQATNSQIRLFVANFHSAAAPGPDSEGSWVVCSPDVAKSFSAIGYYFGKEIATTEKVPVGMIGLFGKNDAMIDPLLPFTLKGVIWYENELAAVNTNYFKHFSSMIEDWRRRWGQGDFPFLYVQLPNCYSRQPQPVDQSQWAWVREAQMMTFKAVANTGMAVTIDIGTANSLHPSDKIDVAHRLALTARHVAYGEDIVFCGPIFDSYKIDGNKIHVTFKDIGRGLKIGGSYFMPSPNVFGEGSEIKGFAIAGVDSRFVWAKARIESPDTVCVSSDEVSEPVAVRYGWADNPEVNLYNSADLPASPFRSDGPIAPPQDAMLVADTDNFFAVNDIQYYGDNQNSKQVLFEDVTKPDKNKKMQTTYVFTPYLAARVRVKEPTKSYGLVARAYFYDQNKKLIASMQQPTDPVKNNHYFYSWPVIFPKDKPQSLFFVVPDQVLKESNWSAIVVFGDSKGVSAKLCSITDEFNELSEYDYPGKLPPQRPPDRTSDSTISRVVTVDPIIEHVEKTEDPNQPQITLFLRLPLGMTDASQAKGLLAMCVVAGGVDAVKRQLQGAEAADQLSGPLRFAEEHKLAVLCWGSHNLWDPRKNWDEQSIDTNLKIDKEFDQIANAWVNGVQYFVKEYDIPQNNYLLWGESESAQYACRLALRKPEYFLAIHAHIPSSFDKPTVEANHVLWCLTTGELESGHARSLRFYEQCRQLGYPIIYKAIPGLGHSWNYSSANLGLKFFAYALGLNDQRTAYEKSLNNPLAQFQIAQTSDGAIQPWLESFRKPAYVGDIVNQGIFPSDQADMVPSGFRTSLPTKEIAEAWNQQ